MKNIQVDLPRTNYHYQVKIGGNILKNCLSEIFAHTSQKTLYLITNETINRLYSDFDKKYLPDDLEVKFLTLPDGEQYKNMESVNKIYDFLAKGEANRKSVVAAAGGGVIGDTVGFAAATFMRGIPFILIPTSLLSQVDSGIGGKTAINHKHGKNMIGLFQQPMQTIIDVDFLETIPDREFTSGYAELIKHGIIRDAYLFQILTRKSTEELRSNRELLIEAIFRSCEVKARMVEKDEKEYNQRTILNFGHTMGHFLEALTEYKEITHGEAIIIGMAFATWWSFKHKSILEKSDYLLINDHLKSLKIKKKIPATSKENFLKIIKLDKKMRCQGIRFVGLTSIGNARVFENVEPEELWKSFNLFMEDEDYIQIR